ncbi:MAG: O-antigen ligase family protein [Caldilineales bacterium]|nr:O-antigen ligase family protein [Caldilineales bacterium]
MSRRRSTSAPALLQLDLSSAALLVALVAVPAYFNAQSGASFEPDKGAILRTLALLAAISVAIGWVQAWRSGQRPKLSGLDPSLVLLCAFVIVVGLSTAFGADSTTSFGGNYDRGYGALTIAAWAVMVYVAFLGARRLGVWLFVDVIALSAAAPALYGLLQILGFDPVTGQSVSFVLGQRASASLGNPLFLGDFLLLVVLLLAARIVVGPPLDRLRRMGLLGYLALLAAALIATGSRSAYLGLVVALVFLLVAWGYQERRRRAKAAGIIVAAAGLLVLLLAWATPNLLPARLSDLFASGGTGGQRLLFWQAVIDLVRDRPALALTGIGPDALPLGLAPYLPATLAHFEPDWVFRIPDRAHTLPLDLVGETGFLGLIALSLFWASLIARITPSLPVRHSSLIKIIVPIGGAILFATLAAMLIGLPAAPLGFTTGFLAGAFLPYLFGLGRGEQASERLSPLAPFLLAALAGRWFLLGFSFRTHAPDLVFAIVAGLALLEPWGGIREKPVSSANWDDSLSRLAGSAAAVFAFSLANAMPPAMLLWLSGAFLLVFLVIILSRAPGQMRAKGLSFILPTLLLLPAIWLNRTTGVSAWLAYSWFWLWLLGLCVWLLPSPSRRKGLAIAALSIPLALLLSLPVYGDIAFKTALLKPNEEAVRTESLNRAFLLSPHDDILAISIVPTENQFLPFDADLDHPQAVRIRELYERAIAAQPLAPEPVMLYAEWLRQRAAGDPNATALALEQYARGLALSPNDIQARNSLAVLHESTGADATAEDELRDLLAVDPLYGPTYLNLAEIQRRRGDIEAARQTLTSGVRNVFWWPALQQALDALP